MNSDSKQSQLKFFDRTPSFPKSNIYNGSSIYKQKQSSSSSSTTPAPVRTVSMRHVFSSKKWSLDDKPCHFRIDFHVQYSEQEIFDNKEDYECLHCSKKIGKRLYFQPLSVKNDIYECAPFYHCSKECVGRTVHNTQNNNMITLFNRMYGSDVHIAPRRELLHVKNGFTLKEFQHANNNRIAITIEKKHIHTFRAVHIYTTTLRPNKQMDKEVVQYIVHKEQLPEDITNSSQQFSSTSSSQPSSQSHTYKNVTRYDKSHTNSILEKIVDTN